MVGARHVKVAERQTERERHGGGEPREQRIRKERVELEGQLTESKRMLELRNDLGLLSEEYDPEAKRLIGNFPQGFSHIGLINTAFNLVKARGPAQQRSERVAPSS